MNGDQDLGQGSTLPEPDPTKVQEKSALHMKLVEGRLSLELEQAKAAASAELEDQKAAASAELENQKAAASAELENQKAAASAELEAQKAAIAVEKAQLDRALAQQKEENEALLGAEKGERDKELELRGLYHQKITEVAAGTIERARDSAKFVQTAAAAILTAYAALLGIVFSAEGRPLPLRGVWAAVFLGLAVSLAVAYLAFLKKGSTTPGYAPAPSIPETQLARTAAFAAWANAGANNRRSALRASVVAFAFGIAFIPAAFISPIGTSAQAASAVPSVPAIPAAIPPEIADDATRLFHEQVERYLAALRAVPTTLAEEPGCSSPVDTFQACAWATQGAVERSFVFLALLALLVVVLVPLAFWLRERTSSS